MEIEILKNLVFVKEVQQRFAYRGIFIKRMVTSLLIMAAGLQISANVSISNWKSEGFTIVMSREELLDHI